MLSRLLACANNAGSTVLLLPDFCLFAVDDSDRSSTLVSVTLFSLSIWLSFNLRRFLSGSEDETDVDPNIEESLLSLSPLALMVV